MSDENEVLDLNDPKYDQEVYQGDPEADYNAFTPIPDGVHMARLTYQEGKDAYGKPYTDRQSGEEITMIVAPLEIIIQEEGQPYDKQKMRDWVTSLISFRTKTSTIGDICRIVGQRHPSPISPAGLKRHFDTVVAGEPLLRVKTVWTGSCETCRKGYVERNSDSLGPTALKKAANAFGEKGSLEGMRNWPQDEKGEFKHEVACPDCGEEVQARPKVKKYLALT